MIDVRGTDEVKAAALLFSRADRATRQGIAKEAKAWAPHLQRAVAAHAREPVDRAIAASGKMSVTSRGIKAVFGSSGRLSSGEPLREVTRPQEFGTGQRDAWNEYLGRSPKGRAVRFRRRTQRQVPRRKDSGRFIYPGVADAAPELVSRWVRAVAQAVTRG